MEITGQEVLKKLNNEIPSVVLEIPIHFSQFKDNYDYVLKYYLSIHEKNTELSFIQDYISTYKKLISLIKNKLNLENLTEIDNEIIQSLSEKGYYYDLKLSFKLIVDFLKSKERVTKIESIKKY
jgi:hypothetical protein